ncbi:MAG: GAF domain-containing protein [Chloroflexi bacterium]|nr:GAF domain-containing protein [Chloroflexota bacterium]
MEDKFKSLTWHELLGQIIEDPQEKQRIALEMRISPITLVRWANKESKPRDENMRLLLKALPRDFYKLFAQLIAEDFPNLSLDNTMTAHLLQEPPPEFYARVLSAYTSTPEPLYTQTMYDLILQQTIEHLDPERQGMSVSIVRCVRPLHSVKVRSLRQVSGIGTPPWHRDLEQETIFLGAESLAGTAVINCRLACVQSREEQSSFAHWTEYEHSAAAYPLMRRTKVGGCLLASSALPHYFSKTHLSLVEYYANLTALALEPEDFFDLKDIQLGVMPHYTAQEPYFRHFSRRVTQKFAEAAVERKLMTLREAQTRVWQEIEEELLQLPPYLGP